MADPVKKRLIIEFDDYCDEPFTELDVQNLKEEFEKMMLDYDVEINDVKLTIEEGEK